MGVLDRLLHRRRSQGKDNRDGFELTEVELGMINEFMPLDRGGLLAFKKEWKKRVFRKIGGKTLYLFSTREKMKFLLSKTVRNVRLDWIIKNL